MNTDYRIWTAPLRSSVRGEGNYNENIPRPALDYQAPLDFAVGFRAGESKAAITGITE